MRSSERGGADRVGCGGSLVCRVPGASARRDDVRSELPHGPACALLPAWCHWHAAGQCTRQGSGTHAAAAPAGRCQWPCAPAHPAAGWCRPAGPAPEPSRHPAARCKGWTPPPSEQAAAGRGAQAAGATCAAEAAAVCRRSGGGGGGRAAGAGPLRPTRAAGRARRSRSRGQIRSWELGAGALLLTGANSERRGELRCLCQCGEGAELTRIAPARMQEGKPCMDGGARWRAVQPQRASAATAGACAVWSPRRACVL